MDKDTTRNLLMALEISKLVPLYPKDEQDIRISIAINQGIEKASDVNDILDSYNLPLLMI